MHGEFTVKSTISTSNSEVVLIMDGQRVCLLVEELSAVVEILKQQVSCIGKGAVRDVEIGQRGTGVLTYAVTESGVLRHALSAKELDIEVRNLSDAGEYGEQAVRLSGVLFDNAAVGSADSQNKTLTHTLPFTFQGAEIIQNFSEEN